MMKISVTVSRENLQAYPRWTDVASFEAEADEASIWAVYRDSLAALTPEPDEKGDDQR